ncbi:MAG: DUF2760 domain-containing protein, partial [Verrucomicrobia bacterium]|nr:DUF2760 domain-containing protein [Verrucomicrobiota bacterium]
VHAGCAKVLREHFTLEPARSEAEGSRVVLEAGFDAARNRLTGNVTGATIVRAANSTGISGTFSSTNVIGSYTTTLHYNANSITVDLTSPPHLAITAVNGGGNPSAGTGFSVTVQTQSGTGAAMNVASDTAVLLSLNTGSGTLGGTLTGTITAGNNSATISGVTYTKAESGVVLTATRTSGDTFASGSSAPFTVNAGAAANLALTSGNNQNNLVGSALASPFVVTVTDANGNAVAGTNVTFAIASVPDGATGQSLSVTNATTAANGQASSILTLGNTVGTYTVTATSGSLTGSPVTFTATGTPIPPTKLVVTSVNGGASPAAGTPFSVTVQAQDSVGTPRNVFADTAVTLVRTSGSGTLGGTLTGVISNGTSSLIITGVTYTKAETNVAITVSTNSGMSLTAGSSAPFTVTPGAAASIALTSGNGQSGNLLTALPSPFVVTVTDANSNLVAGASVTFAVASVPGGATGQSLSVTNATTGANGQASSVLIIGNQTGAYTVTATSGSLIGSPVTFNATGAIIPPTKLAITSVNGGANPAAGSPFSVVVQSQDAGGVPRNVQADTAVTLALTTGSGMLGGTLTGTISSGSNSVTLSGVTYTKAESGVVLTVSTNNGMSLTAGNSAPFTVNAGAAANLALTSGNNQSGLTTSNLASPFVVTVTDANANPVSGASVTFAIASVPGGATGQSLSVTNATTAANGQASSLLKVGSLGGAYTVTATAGILNGSPVTFTASAVLPWDGKTCIYDASTAASDGA